MEKTNYPPYHYYVCGCDEEKEFTPTEMLAHYKEVHGIELAGKKLNRNLMVHISRKPRNASIYEWTPPEGDIKFYEYLG